MMNDYDHCLLMVVLNKFYFFSSFGFLKHFIIFMYGARFQGGMGKYIPCLFYCLYFVQYVVVVFVDFMQVGFILVPKFPKILGDNKCQKFRLASLGS